MDDPSAESAETGRVTATLAIHADLSDTSGPRGGRSNSVLAGSIERYHVVWRATKTNLQ